MSTSFVTLVPPAGLPQADAYKLLEQASTGDLPADAPTSFVDALIVRKSVFVDEQHCRLSTEIDEDDARSFHWVIYASVAASAADARAQQSAGQQGDAFARRKSVGGSVPVVTVRLVPPPHGHHPAPGSMDGEGGERVVGRVDEGKGDVATDFHDGREPYVKLGRLATVKEYRGNGLGRLIVSEALDWLAREPDAILGLPEDPLERERISRSTPEWKGLVLAHAQESAVKFYSALGFEVDPKLGEWIEEGINHVAMWKRVDLKRQ